MVLPPSIVLILGADPSHLNDLLFLLYHCFSYLNTLLLSTYSLMLIQYFSMRAFKLTKMSTCHLSLMHPYVGTFFVLLDELHVHVHSRNQRLITSIIYIPVGW